MKKTKIIIVSVLAVILCVMCVTTSTFSWFTRPQTMKGDSLGWKINYDTSVGSGVTMKTYASIDGGSTYNEAQKITSFSNSSGIAAGGRVWYRTDITNNGASPQSVSLYLSKLTLPENAQGSFCLGVNNPLKTYKNYSLGGGTSTTDILNEKHSNSKMRIYFQPKSSTMSEPDVNWKGKNYYVCYGVSASPSSYLALTQIGTTGTYYADIPSTATQLFISVQDWKQSYQRTQTFTDIKSDGQSQTQSLVFYLNGSYDSSAYNNAQADKSQVNGANIVNYYSKITIPAKKTFPAALASGTDYIGSEIKYVSSNSAVFTVDTSGNITAVSEGTATLTTKITGADFSDTVSVVTTVTVTKATTVATDGITDVPIITNVKVNGISDVGEATTESIYWYIKNDGSGALTYTIEDVYLTL